MENKDLLEKCNKRKVLKEYVKNDEICIIASFVTAFLFIAIFVSFALLLYILIQKQYDAFNLTATLVVLFMSLFSCGGIMNIKDHRVLEIQRAISATNKEEVI
jgi:preprotein translocase subunit SecG